MSMLRHALEHQRHTPVAGAAEPAPAAHVDVLVRTLRANGLLAEAEQVQAIAAERDQLRALRPPQPCGFGPVHLNGELVRCPRAEERQPCPHRPERRCAVCPGRPVLWAPR